MQKFCFPQLSFMSFCCIIGCSFKFILKVGVEESRISSLNLTSLFALFVFLLCKLASGAFTVDSSTPTLTVNTLLVFTPLNFVKSTLGNGRIVMPLYMVYMVKITKCFINRKIAYPDVTPKIEK
jgi:hypothetical protein